MFPLSAGDVLDDTLVFSGGSATSATIERSGGGTNGGVSPSVNGGTTNTTNTAMECVMKTIMDGTTGDNNVDYTPPELVDMFFTNEGVLTPPGVGELFLKALK